MECNRDEALRAKEIAEKKFTAKDIVGAMKFALKAQTLFPELEGIQQMVTTMDIYIAAEQKVNGEPDWYRILGVDPRANEEAVRRQYRKLALMLHPDKNKAIGGDGAFKLVSQAWSLLSDKARRTTYDQMRNVRTSQKVPAPSGGSSTPSRANGYHNPTKNSTSSSSNSRSQKSTGQVGQSSHKKKANTFWTVCHRCKMQYEYLRVYLNHNLLCPNCQAAFFAIEISPPPSNRSRCPIPTNFSHHKTSSKNAKGYNSLYQTNSKGAQFSATGVASSAAESSHGVHQVQKKVKRDHEDAQAFIKREEALRRKTAAKGVTGLSGSGQSNSSKRKGMVGDDHTNCQQKDARKIAESTDEVIHPDVQKKMIEKVRIDIRNNLDKLKLGKAADQAATKGDENGTAKKNGSTSGKSLNKETESPSVKSSLDGSNFDRLLDGENEVTVEKCSLAVHDADGGTLVTLSIDVPSSDFHDFDKVRTEKSFGEKQIWAVYDDDDGMPRHYAMIRNVISLNPFILQISWLNPRTTSSLGLLNWVISGFSLTCGDFEVGRSDVFNSLYSFSHKVKWMTGADNAIRIVPQKGDVWAIYRNWSSDWNELTAGEVIHKYDMVEVLENYDDEQGITIIPLVKVAGFKTLFHHHLDFREIRRIPKEEISRFSHYIPSFLHMGQEAPNAPKGCLELDPAATPQELL